MECRVIETGSGDAYYNMAVDEAIAHFCQVPTLRLYQWNPAAVSIGYNQDVENEVDIENCYTNDIPVVRRITGGKAIFHDNELTYSFIVPEGMLSLPQNVIESYKVIADSLIKGLEMLGMKAQLKKTPDKFADPICFNSSNWYELMVNGKKISGSAQKRFKGVVMQHGSILIDFDYGKNVSLFRSLTDEKNLMRRVTSIKREFGKVISFKELSSAIKMGFHRNFGFKMFSDTFTRYEKKLANKLKAEKYSTKSWNYNSIDFTNSEKLINH